jgi:hypothetical protein
MLEDGFVKLLYNPKNPITKARVPNKMVCNTPAGKEEIFLPTREDGNIVIVVPLKLAYAQLGSVAPKWELLEPTELTIEFRRKYGVRETKVVKGISLEDRNRVKLDQIAARKREIANKAKDTAAALVVALEEAEKAEKAALEAEELKNKRNTEATEAEETEKNLVKENALKVEQAQIDAAGANDTARKAEVLSNLSSATASSEDALLTELGSKDSEVTTE